MINYNCDKQEVGFSSSKVQSQVNVIKGQLNSIETEFKKKQYEDKFLSPDTKTKRGRSKELDQIKDRLKTFAKDDMIHNYKSDQKLSEKEKLEHISSSDNLSREIDSKNSTFEKYIHSLNNKFKTLSLNTDNRVVETLHSFQKETVETISLLMREFSTQILEAIDRKLETYESIEKKVTKRVQKMLAKSSINNNQNNNHTSNNSNNITSNSISQPNTSKQQSSTTQKTHDQNYKQQYSKPLRPNGFLADSQTEVTQYNVNYPQHQWMQTLSPSKVSININSSSKPYRDQGYSATPLKKLSQEKSIMTDQSYTNESNDNKNTNFKSFYKYTPNYVTYSPSSPRKHDHRESFKSELNNRNNIVISDEFKNDDFKTMYKSDTSELQKLSKQDDKIVIEKAQKQIYPERFKESSFEINSKFKSEIDSEFQSNINITSVTNNQTQDQINNQDTSIIKTENNVVTGSFANEIIEEENHQDHDMMNDKNKQIHDASQDSNLLLKGNDSHRIFVTATNIQNNRLQSNTESKINEDTNTNTNSVNFKLNSNTDLKKVLNQTSTKGSFKDTLVNTTSEAVSEKVQNSSINNKSSTINKELNFKDTNFESLNQSISTGNNDFNRKFSSDTFHKVPTVQLVNIKDNRYTEPQETNGNESNPMSQHSVDNLSTHKSNKSNKSKKERLQMIKNQFLKSEELKNSLSQLNINTNQISQVNEDKEMENEKENYNNKETPSSKKNGSNLKLNIKLPLNENVESKSNDQSNIKLDSNKVEEKYDVNQYKSNSEIGESTQVKYETNMTSEQDENKFNDDSKLDNSSFRAISERASFVKGKLHEKLAGLENFDKRLEELQQSSSETATVEND